MPPHAKKYGQSCLLCRRRKVRCDGGKPSCGKCTRTGERCNYGVHDSAVARLRNALSRSEQRLRQLERDLGCLLSLEPIQCQEGLRVLLAQVSLEEAGGEKDSILENVPVSADAPGEDGSLSSLVGRHHQTTLNADEGLADEEEVEEVGCGRAQQNDVYADLAQEIHLDFEVSCRRARL